MSLQSDGLTLTKAQKTLRWYQTGMKVCPQCGVDKPVATGFGYCNVRHGGKPRPYCHPCRNERVREQRKSRRKWMQSILEGIPTGSIVRVEVLKRGVDE